MSFRRVAALGLVLLVGLTIGIGKAGAAEQSVRPGINRYYQDPNFNQWLARFERPGREIYDRREAIVAATGLRPGMTVADIGAGTGLFSLLFAPEVEPDGKVIAVDISRVFVDNILRRARQAGLGNVDGVVNTDKAVSLPPGSLDLAFLCDTYHHFEYPGSMLGSIREALRPDGTLVVIDFRKVPGLSTPWVIGHVRADRVTAIREIESAGFALVEDNPLLRTNYFLRFRKTLLNPEN